MNALNDTLNVFRVTQGRCMEDGDPCPRSECRHHVHNSAKESQVAKSALSRNTCALKLANRGGITLDEIGDLLGLTRERVRQIEVHALGKLFRGLENRHLLDGIDDFLHHLNNRGS